MKTEVINKKAIYRENNSFKNTKPHSLSIGTLTFHEAGSYGAVFQAYALQQALIDLGVNTEIISYRCPAIWKYREKTINPRIVVGRLLRFPWRIKKIKKFDSFRNKYLSCSKLVVNKKEISDLCQKYDGVIVGSDQIWNTDLTNNDYTYFLDFLNDNNKKIAYAASIGVTSWDNEVEGLVKKISKFRSLSVREKSTANYLNASLGVKADVVCDPTFLIDIERWNKVTEEPSFSYKYILVYMLGKEYEECLRWCHKLSAETNCKIVLVHSNRKKGKKCLNVRSAGPDEMLGLIKNAQFVATNSFHGICLSMIFKKDFVWFRANKEDNNLKQREIRIRDLLSDCNLSDREVTIHSPIPHPINKSALTAVLYNLGQTGQEWLRNAIEH